MAIFLKTKYTSVFREIAGRGEEVIRLENSTTRGLLEYLMRVYGRRFKELVVNPQTGDLDIEGTVLVSRGGHRLQHNDALFSGDEIIFLLAIHE